MVSGGADLNITLTARDLAHAVMSQAYADLEKLQKGANNAQGAFSGGGGSSGGGGGGLLGGITSFGKGLLGAFSQVGFAVFGMQNLIMGVQGVSGALFGSNIAFEKYETQFSTLLGSMGAAKTRMAELEQFARTTPFELPEVVNASRVLQTFVGSAGATGEALKLVGDVAAGTGQQFQDVAMWYGRLQDSLQNGRPAGEALMRLQEMGAISAGTRNEIEKLQESGKGMEAFATFTKNAAANFGGGMEAISRTTGGTLSNIADGFNNAKRRLMDGIMNDLKPSLQQLGDYLGSADFQDKMTEWGRNLASAAKTAVEGIKAVWQMGQDLANSSPVQFVINVVKKASETGAGLDKAAEEGRGLSPQDLFGNWFSGDESKRRPGIIPGWFMGSGPLGLAGSELQRTRTEMRGKQLGVGAGALNDPGDTGGVVLPWAEKAPPPTGGGGGGGGAGSGVTMSSVMENIVKKQQDQLIDAYMKGGDQQVKVVREQQETMMQNVTASASSWSTQFGIKMPEATALAFGKMTESASHWADLQKQIDDEALAKKKAAVDAYKAIDDDAMSQRVTAYLANNQKFDLADAASADLHAQAVKKLTEELTQAFGIEVPDAAEKAKTALAGMVGAMDTARKGALDLTVQLWSQNAAARSGTIEGAAAANKDRALAKWMEFTGVVEALRKNPQSDERDKLIAEAMAQINAAMIAMNTNVSSTKIVGGDPQPFDHGSIGARPFGTNNPYGAGYGPGAKVSEDGSPAQVHVTLGPDLVVTGTQGP